MKSIIIIIATVLLISGCNNLTESEKLILMNINKQVNLTHKSIHHGNKIINYKDFRKKYNFISIVYLKNGCSSYYHNFIRWQKMADYVSKDLKEHDYTVLFVIEEDSYDEFILKVNQIANTNINDHYYSIIDSTYEFIEDNKKIPISIIEKSILIDKENKIKMIGEPWLNKPMKTLFLSICNKHDFND